jgi:radical SAM superfamily enzyme YgiQ (UPF0313 family)
VKILLVHPPIGPNVIGSGILFLAEPLALETIAAPIEEHEQRILDMRIEKSWDGLKEELSRFSPDVVGVTALTTETYQARRVMQIVKEFRPDILTVIGGQHATFMPEDFNCPPVDVIAVGEGVHTFSELIEAYDRNLDFTKIPGLALRGNEKLIFTPKRPPSENLDSMPIPARHLTKRYRDKYFRGTWRPYASMVTSRGCPFRCKFCAVWKTEDGKYRVRSPEKVLEELKSIEQNYVSVSDDNFLHDVKRAEEICELIRTEGIKKKYKLIGRADTIVRRPDVIEKWRDVGMEIMFVGVESFRSKDLAEFNKGTTVEKNTKAIRILQSLGITVSAHFIVHYDYTVEDFEALADYVREMKLKQPIFCILTPLPGTELYFETKDKITTNDYEKFDLLHAVLPTRLPLDEFYAHFADLYRKCYLSDRRPSKEAFISEEIVQLGIAKYLGKCSETPSELQNAHSAS